MTPPTKGRPVTAPIPRALLCALRRPLLRPLQGPLLRVLQNPMLRNGHLLSLSTSLTALIGLGYWAVVAWKYDAVAVGRNSAAISMMLFLSSIAQLDLGSAMVRFVPAAGRHTGRLVAYTFLACGSLAVVISLCFVILARGASSGVTFFDGPLVGVSFAFATLVYTLSVIQDSVLTGLRRTAWVPVKNAAFSVAKLALVVMLAAAMPAYGIFASWALSLGGIVLITYGFLFRWAIPRHQQEGPVHDAAPPTRQILHFVGASYAGGVCSIASMTLMPVLVIRMLGPQQNAHFALAWTIAYSVHLININMGASLVVESSIDQSRLSHNEREVLVHISKLLVPVVVLLMGLAPYLLGVFGGDYRSAAGALRLLALAALPHLLIVTAVNSARAQQRLRLVVLVQGAQCVLALGLGWLLLRVLGLVGAGLAWLLTLSLIAGFLIVRRDLWSTVGSTPDHTLSRGVRWQLLGWGPVRLGVRVAAALGVQRWRHAIVSNLRRRRVRNELSALLPGLLPTMPALAGRPGPTTWTTVRPIRTVSDLDVAFLSARTGPPVAVLKVARSAQAARELRVQRDALALLSADPRLEDWRQVLPTVLEFREIGTVPVAVEVFLSDTDLATVLARTPDSFERLMTMALGSIVPLHHRTGRTEVVDEEHLARWVDEPLESLREGCQAHSPESITTVERLGETLRSSLRDRPVQVSWTHGDFTPGNVLLAADTERVSGIVDWGGARPGQPSVLDSYLMLIMARRCVHGQELGTIIARLLHAGGLPERDRRLLAQASAPPSGAVSRDEPEQRALILLTWLHHVAELQRKCGLYRDHRIWWMLNVEPVLRTLATLSHRLEAAGPPDDVPSDQPVRAQLVDRAAESSEHGAEATVPLALTAPVTRGVARTLGRVFGERLRGTGSATRSRIGALGHQLALAVPAVGMPAALVLWLASLPHIPLDRMGDYGLVPLLPPTFWLTLAVLLVSYSVLLSRRRTSTPLLAGHVFTLIAILHATPCLVYGSLRYSWAWKHVGVVDFFIRHPDVVHSIQIRPFTVYEFWPGFFTLNATLTQASGLQSSLGYANWAPPFVNALLVGPLYLIFRTFTHDRRLIWSAIGIFFLGSWVGQDYFSPQATTYFLYLTTIALCLRYLKPKASAATGTPPPAPAITGSAATPSTGRGEPGIRGQRLLIAGALAPMVAIVPTHQLTPLMLVTALVALTVFCRQRVAVLALVMIGLTLGWDLIFAQQWIMENLDGIESSVGALGANANSGFINLADVSKSQAVVAKIDRVHSAAVWVLAVLGFGLRFRSRRELPLALLAVTPILMIMTNDYGGEMIHRVFVFGLPFTAFYAAAVFFPKEESGRSWWTRLALPAVLLLMVPGFAFGYYGKEQVNYYTPQEISAARFLNGIAPRGSLILGATGNFPWVLTNYEHHDYLWFALLEPKNRQDILDDPVGAFRDLMVGHHHSYLLLTRGQDAEMEMTGMMPRDGVEWIEHALLHSPEFTVLYRNADAVLLTLSPPAPEVTP